MAAVIVPPFALRSKILKKTAASLGITQFITSWAITILGLIKYPHSMLDPHARMCLTLALLGSASHDVPFWLGQLRTKRASSVLRIGLCAAQDLVHFAAFLARKRPVPDERDTSGKLLTNFPNITILFTCLANLILIVFTFFIKTPTVFLRLIVTFRAGFFTILYISIVIQLKFQLRDCNMKTGDENQWTFGQYLALFVLVAPIYSTLEAFLGM